MSFAAILTAGFVVQFWLPLRYLGSTALGASVWVLVSVAVFVLPCLILRCGRTTAKHLVIALALFLPPAIAIGVSNLANGNFDARDTSDLFRAVYFMLAFLAGAKLASDEDRLRSVLEGCFRWSLPLLLAYLSLSLALRDAVDDAELLFGKIDNVVSGRLFAPFPNPYDLALFCTLPLFYYLLKGRNGAAIAVALVLIATQSRTGILLAAIGLAIASVASGTARRSALKFVVLVSILLVLTFVLFVDLEDIKSLYLISNTIGLMEGHSTTLSRRFAQWDYVRDLPLLGWGTIRSLDLVIENAVIYEIYRTGLAGAYSLLSFYVLPACVALRAIWVSKGAALLTAMAIFVLLTIIGFSSSVFIYQPKLSLLYWFTTGALVSLCFPQASPVALAINIRKENGALVQLHWLF